MKAGRNEPCPCGSGKKYKKCCLQAVDPREADYRRITGAYDALVARLLPFSDKNLGQDLMDQAFDAFLLWDQALIAAPFEGFSQLFVPWALFAWELTEQEHAKSKSPPLLPPGTTIAECYAEKKGQKLEPLERAIIRAAVRAPLSFHEILDSRPGQGFTCRDLCTEQIREVWERSASEHLQPGDIFFCSITRVDSVDMLLGTSPMKHGQADKPQILALRQELAGGDAPLTPERLHAADQRLRALYYSLMGRKPAATPVVV